ncbi:Predicted metalloprotease, contains C-terminal PDZ domain [Hymenobacter daecheongensis DSM 21074]|uniref:Predicted metalloprotease, contains C-terminal PDZ domain n=1 Tax=Hymenobacter daecheongensis DSM 21074 TaxID=1121955 RepID=A0A1M6LS97_9BACT|nr:PDZ domain-containing protein [Hymenobacter daecheongensis]SHJ74114.1 Predicted metalloprotease, contains C-terminal PDZ domain [Hymenobacter daecheongensis DSM 21074]
MRNIAASFPSALALLLSASSLFFSAEALAQAPVQYSVAFPNAVHHEARITVVFAEVPAGPLQVRMARSSPGRYALHEFAKNVYDVQATDAKGRALPISRPDPYGWDVSGHDGTVRFTYTLFGDRTDGTYAGIDAVHAHLNMPATLAYARGQEQRPAEVRFELPTGWQVATQLRPDPAKGTYYAPHLQYLMDSPTSLGAQQLRTWQEQGRTIELSVLHDGTAAELDAYTDQTKKVVKAAAAIFGGLPEYDFGRYTFVANYLPQTSSDGMEHRNSTSLTSSRPLRGAGALDNLGTVAHEFFHSWNVERLRPRDLEPFDFERANMSNSLWFAEGFTQYYGELLLRRAGIYTDEQYCQEALSGLVNAMLNAPGAARYSPVQMSQQAPFVDAAAAIDPNNRQNTYLSYYYIGGANALALDLMLRQRHNTTLDTYMRALWQKFGQAQQNYAPARPYTLADLQRVLGEVSRDTAFAGSFFRQHITGHELPRFDELLAPAGLLVRRAKAGQASLMARLSHNPTDSSATVGGTLIGSPLYQAGLDREDVVRAINGQRLVSAKTLTDILATHKPGDVLAVDYRTRAGLRTAQVTLAEDPTLEVVPYEAAKKPVTKAMRKFRAEWLDGKAK